MRRHARLIVATLFVALFALLPAPDESTGRPYLGFLAVREWLLDPADSPLRNWVVGSTLPVLLVDLRQSPPIEDAALLAAKATEYARCAKEWAAARSQEGTAVRTDPSRGALSLLVHIGLHGVRATVDQPDGTTRTLSKALASRWSLLPAALAIALAILLRRVLPALLLACIGGAMAFVGTGSLDPAVGSSIVWRGGWHFLDTLWNRSVLGDLNLQISAFVVCLFLMITIVTRNGGIDGMVAILHRHVRGPVSAQLSAFATGLVIFFDDYSSCLIAGSTMRPITDAARVSRQKLAWIVDSTAAPVAGLSIFSTWITYEISQYSAPLTLVTKADGTPYAAADAYGVFLDALPFRFYCWYTLALVFLVIVLRRDLGPMLGAERLARRSAARLPGSEQPIETSTGVASTRMVARSRTAAPRARNAVVPLCVLVFGTLGGMLWNGLGAARPAGLEGFGATLRFVLANADSVTALLWASAASCAIAVIMTLAQRLLSVRELLLAIPATLHLLLPAFGILFLAWTLGHLCHDLGTSSFLAAAARGAMSAAALPLVLLLCSSLIAFASGSSFGTMAIMLPNVVLLAHQLGTDAAFLGSPATGGPALLVLSIGAVLEGAIFGDHCSPISDTTVLSSLGAQCDHLSHVETQMPYALLGLLTAITFGYVPMVWLGPSWWWLSIAGGLGMMVAVLYVFGRDPDRPLDRAPPV